MATKVAEFKIHQKLWERIFTDISEQKSETILKVTVKYSISMPAPSRHFESTLKKVISQNLSKLNSLKFFEEIFSSNEVIIY